MRGYSIVLALPLLALAACGGSGPESVGSVAPPAPTGGSGTGGGVGSAPTPTPSTGGAGSGTGVSPSPTPSATTPPAGFLTVSTETTFNAIGAAHSFTYTTTAAGTSVLYMGNASTVRSPAGTITYSPRDGVFQLALADAKANMTRNVGYQDPAHRTDFAALTTPNPEVPNLPGFNYLEAGNAQESNIFFYQRPDSTIYVTLAGFAYRGTDQAGVVVKREHGVYVFGASTPQSQVPISGTGTYTGGFLASAVLNPTLDNARQQPSYLQWITGSSAINVDFGTSTVGLSIDGVVGPTFLDGQRISDSALIYPTGTVFRATGQATIDLTRTGGFTGAFSTATLGGTAINFSGITAGSNVAGASSIDGGFFGPNGINVGGSFRIVGGVPDQRIDIQGAFTGAKR